MVKWCIVPSRGDSATAIMPSNQRFVHEHLTVAVSRGQEK